jgi:hypothetical protein
MWKDEVMDWKTEENHWESQSGHSISWMRFEPSNSRFHAKTITAWPNLLCNYFSQNNPELLNMLLRFSLFVSRQSMFLLKNRDRREKYLRISASVRVGHHCRKTTWDISLTPNFSFIRGISLLRCFSYFPSHTTPFVSLEHTKHTYMSYLEKK